MSQYKTWTLTDVADGVYVDDWSLTSDELGIPFDRRWTIQKRTLRGGLRDGVDVIRVDNGQLSFVVVPTRGMGLWRGECQDVTLGWRSPVLGPVHPSFVNLLDLNGIGWISGFDEWVVRCGLNSNGAPGVDVIADNEGTPRETMLTLHGRIANLPAHTVSVRVNRQPPHQIEIVGVVDEAMLFGTQLRLTARIRTTPGSNAVTIHDTITNMRSVPSELELLYHCNFGPPLLSANAKIRAPAMSIAPFNDVAAREIDAWDRFPAPTPGVIETCFAMLPIAHPETGQSLVMLENGAGDKACGLRFAPSQLPCFTLWKNPGAESDGYVTGLEPATNFPNSKKFERSKGRVISLPPGGSQDAEITLEVARSKAEVAQLREEVAELQALATRAIHRLPHPDFSDRA